MDDSHRRRREAVRRVADHYLRTAVSGDRALRPYPIEPFELPPAPSRTIWSELSDQSAATAWFEAERTNILGVIDRAARAGLRPYVWWLAHSLTTFLQRGGHWQDRLWALTAALEAVRGSGQPRDEAFVHRMLANACARVESFAQAHVHLGEACRLYGELDDTLGLGAAHRGYAWLLELEGRPADALAYAEQAYEFYRRARHRAAQARALNMVGWLNTRLGEHTVALAQCQRALATLREIGDHEGEAAAWDSYGCAHHGLGHHEQAIECYERSAALLRDQGDHYNEADVLRRLGEAYREAGQPDLGVQAWARAVELLDRLAHPDADGLRARLDRPAA